MALKTLLKLKAILTIAFVFIVKRCLVTSQLKTITIVIPTGHKFRLSRQAAQLSLKKETSEGLG